MEVIICFYSNITFLNLPIWKKSFLEILFTTIFGNSVSNSYLFCDSLESSLIQWEHKVAVKDSIINKPIDFSKAFGRFITLPLTRWGDICKMNKMEKSSLTIWTKIQEVSNWICVTLKRWL